MEDSDLLKTKTAALKIGWDMDFENEVSKLANLYITGAIGDESLIDTPEPVASLRAADALHDPLHQVGMYPRDSSVIAFVYGRVHRQRLLEEACRHLFDPVFHAVALRGARTDWEEIG